MACLCYLAAAASGRPGGAWPAIAGGPLVVVAAELACLPWWSGVAGTALILVAVGLVTRVPPPSAQTAQTVTMAGFGAVAQVVAAVVGRGRYGQNALAAAVLAFGHLPVLARRQTG